MNKMSNVLVDAELKRKSIPLIQSYFKQTITEFLNDSLSGICKLHEIEKEEVEGVSL